MFLPHCLSNYEGSFACIADLQVVHVDGQDHSHQRLRGRLCISLTACTHRPIRITTSFCLSEAKNFSSWYKRQIACYKCKVFFKIHFTSNILKRGRVTVISSYCTNSVETFQVLKEEAHMETSEITEVYHEEHELSHGHPFCFI